MTTTALQTVQLLNAGANLQTYVQKIFRIKNSLPHYPVITAQSE